MASVNQKQNYKINQLYVRQVCNAGLRLLRVTSSSLLAFLLHVVIQKLFCTLWGVHVHACCQCCAAVVQRLLQQTLSLTAFRADLHKHV